MTDEIDRATARRVLDLEMLGNEPGASTVREYLSELLWEMWTRDDFDATRPFGSTEWKRDLYRPLLEAGLIAGRENDRGHLEEFDTEAGDRLILAAIAELGEKP